MSEEEKPAPEIRGGNRPTDYIPEENPFHAPFEGWSEKEKAAWVQSQCDDPDDEADPSDPVYDE